MPSEHEWILYGAAGYTGRLIAAEASRRGLRPILAGRTAETVEKLATSLGLPCRVFCLDDPHALAQSLRGARLVLNCAGPFSATAGPLMAACLAERLHYLDITGEIEVIESAASLDQAAKSAGIVLLPAVGFDVVPSDCLAAKLARRLPDANRLQLAIASSSELSPGTAKTMLEAVASGGRARISGRIVRVPAAWKTRDVPFRGGTLTTFTIPWGDVASAYYSTGIGDIEVYAAMSRRKIKQLRRWRWLLPVLAIGPMRKIVSYCIERRVRGPAAAERESRESSLWGRVENREGQYVEATLITPNGYTLTVQSALAAVERFLESPPSGGFLTPSMAFGPDFINTLDGCDFRLTDAGS